MSARQENLRTAWLAPDVVDIGADAIAVAKHFARQHFVAAHDGFTAAEIDHDVTVLDALDDAVDDVADAILVFVILPVAFGFADFLHDHLLCRLRGNPPIFERRQRIGDGVSDLRGGMPPARVFEADLGRGVFNCVDHQHVAREMKLAALRVDLRADFGFAAVSRARRFGDSVFHRAQNDLTVDRLFASDCVRDLQQFKSIGANGRHR